MSNKLIVFDWDGTLMDSQKRIVDCMQLAIQEAGLPSRSGDEVSNIIGLGLREALEYLFPQGGEDDYRKLVEGYRHHFMYANDTPTPLFDGAEMLLARLYENGHFLAIATGKGRRGLDKVLDETQLGKYFHYTRCADETFSKPHPGMLLEIIDQLGVEKSVTLMIGDTEYDLQMAKNAGVGSLAVSYGVHDVSRLMACDPMACLDSLGEIGEWLDEHFLSGPVLNCSGGI